MGHFLYPRHFLLLLCLSVLLAVMPRPHTPRDLNSFFALYGALHASALSLTLRARQPIWQKCLFVAIAAGLSVISVRVGIVGGHLSETLPGNYRLYAALCLLATLVALFTGSYLHVLGPWWLAVLWWHAFSGALWYCDLRPLKD